ncbi:hypothetical protein Hesp01_74090 [Herbidospora sp. NBRC 101105]|nr:hypothetical protein Hesp01_74090 [Herbidospora sp. NBRC 101105]
MFSFVAAGRMVLIRTRAVFCSRVIAAALRFNADLLDPYVGGPNPFRMPGVDVSVQYAKSGAFIDSASGQC